MAPYTHPKDAVWFITGCSSGIGLALVSYLLTHHPSNRVVATARNTTSLASSLPSSSNLLVLPLDVTSESSIQSALDHTISHFKRIDVIVNNAGFGLMADTETVDVVTPTSPARQVLEANFWGAVRISQHAVRIFREENGREEAGGRRGGLLMQVTSMGGRLAFAGNAFYHASKFALEGFTEALAKEVAEEWGVHFLVVEPGGVKTRWAQTSTEGWSEEGRLEAYKDPKLATNVLLKYKTSEDATKGWADVEKVVEVLGEFVIGGGEWELRLPLGADAWGMQKIGYEEGLRGLEKVKHVSMKTSGEEQLQSIAFLRK